jgi:hypothetical protein
MSEGGGADNGYLLDSHLLLWWWFLPEQLSSGGLAPYPRLTAIPSIACWPPRQKSSG